MGTTPQDVRDISGSKLSDDDISVFISAADALLLLIPDQTELYPLPPQLFSFTLSSFHRLNFITEPLSLFRCQLDNRALLYVLGFSITLEILFRVLNSVFHISP